MGHPTCLAEEVDQVARWSFLLVTEAPSLLLLSKELSSEGSFFVANLDHVCD